MKLRISETMDGFFDNDIEMENVGVVDADRVRELTMAKLGISPAKATRRPARKLGRVLLVAAAVVMVLSAAAVAVYQYGMKDTVIEEMPDFSDVTQVRVEQSLNGFADSPEYQAYVEWATWERLWSAENEDWFKNRGVDDTYSEVDEAYAMLYGIHAQEQADKFDEIMKKYGLTPHTAQEGFNTEAQLCAALGVEDFLDERFDIRGDYLFEDGAFKAVGTFPMDGEEVWVNVINAVKGSITMISSGVPEEYEEWIYTTDSGIEVILATYEDGAWMVADLPGTYVTVTFNAPLAKAQVEDLVNDIDLAVLAERFDGSVSREESAAMLAAWQEVRQNATISDNADDDTALAMSILGNYYLADVPEEAYIYSTGGNIPYTWGEISEEYFAITHRYQYKEGEITLSFHTLDDRGMDLDAYVGDHLETVTDCTVNGYEGRVIELNDGEDCSVYWLDTDRELWFRVGTPYAKDEAIALAESVTAEDAALDASGPEGREMRIALHEQEIEEARARIIGEYEAMEAEGQAIFNHALETLGNYEITALPEGYERLDSRTNDIRPFSDASGKDVGYQLDMNTQYMADSGSLLLRYLRCWDENDESVSWCGYLFDSMKSSAPELGVEKTDCTVNGMEAVIGFDGAGPSLSWWDEEADLIFTVSYLNWSSAYGSDEPTGLTTEDLIALAESVEKQ